MFRFPIGRLVLGVGTIALAMAVLVQCRQKYDYTALHYAQMPDPIESFAVNEDQYVAVATLGETAVYKDGKRVKAFSFKRPCVSVTAVRGLGFAVGLANGAIELIQVPSMTVKSLRRKDDRGFPAGHIVASPNGSSISWIDENAMSVETDGSNEKVMYDSGKRLEFVVAISQGHAVIGTGDRVDGAEEDEVVCIEKSSGRVVWRAITTDVSAVAISGSIAAYATSGKVTFVDLKTGKQLFEAKIQNLPRSISFSPDGRRAVVGDYYRIRCYDTENMKEISETVPVDDAKVIWSNGNTLFAVPKDPGDLVIQVPLPEEWR